jgi:hypothetical protein
MFTGLCATGAESEAAAIHEPGWELVGSQIVLGCANAHPSNEPCAFPHFETPDGKRFNGVQYWFWGAT